MSLEKNILEDIFQFSRDIYVQKVGLSESCNPSSFRKQTAKIVLSFQKSLFEVHIENFLRKILKCLRKGRTVL